jgi:TetR/AcrR family transcriptional repressor of nem operon
MQALVEHMGINRYSIYETFKSKNALFLAVLDHYRDTRIAAVFHDLNQPEAALAELRHFFANRLAAAQTPAARRGCLVCNTTTELVPHDPAIALGVYKSLAHITQTFQHVLKNARARGELSQTTDVSRYAHYLTGVFVGLAVYAKSPVNRQALADYLQVALAAVQ